MTSSRVPLVTAAIVVLVLLVQSVLDTGLSMVYAWFIPNSGAQVFPVVGFILGDGLRIVAFGVGAWFSLRYAAPVRATDAWPRTIGRGVIAALFGTLAVLVLGVVWAILAAVHVSSYPFGYSLDPSINAGSIANSLPNLVNAVADPLIEWVPLVVLAAVLAKVWQTLRPAAPVTVPVSRVETPAGR